MFRRAVYLCLAAGGVSCGVCLSMHLSAGFVNAVPTKFVVSSAERHGMSRGIQGVFRRSHRVLCLAASSASNTNEGVSDGSSGSEKQSEGKMDKPSGLTDNLSKVISGTGSEGCKQCAGVGSIACPVCGSKGYVSINMMDTVSAGQCRLCRGKCVVPCPSCRDFIYRAVVWWDQIPEEGEDPDENWRVDEDGNPRIPWSPPPT